VLPTQVLLALYILTSAVFLPSIPPLAPWPFLASGQLDITLFMNAKQTGNQNEASQCYTQLFSNASQVSWRSLHLVIFTSNKHAFQSHRSLATSVNRAASAHQLCAARRERKMRAFTAAGCPPSWLRGWLEIEHVRIDFEVELGRNTRLEARPKSQLLRRQIDVPPYQKACVGHLTCRIFREQPCAQPPFSVFPRA
jgi:hypothetical protein